MKRRWSGEILRLVELKDGWTEKGPPEQTRAGLNTYGECTPSLSTAKK